MDKRTNLRWLLSRVRPADRLCVWILLVLGALLAAGGGLAGGFALAAGSTSLLFGAAVGLSCGLFLIAMAFVHGVILAMRTDRPAA